MDGERERERESESERKRTKAIDKFAQPHIQKAKQNKNDLKTKMIQSNVAVPKKNTLSNYENNHKHDNITCVLTLVMITALTQ